MAKIDPEAMRAKRGQAMLESVVALIFVTFVMMLSFTLLEMLHARILLDHAAARAARCAAVGLNSFMCEKSALAAMIPVAGRRTWPADEAGDELSRIPIFLASENGARARAVLDYEWWPSTDVDVARHTDLSPHIDARVVMRTDEFSMDGKAAIEAHFPLYMEGLEE